MLAGWLGCPAWHGSALIKLQDNSMAAAAAVVATGHSCLN